MAPVDGASIPYRTATVCQEQVAARSIGGQRPPDHARRFITKDMSCSSPSPLCWSSLASGLSGLPYHGGLYSHSAGSGRDRRGVEFRLGPTRGLKASARPPRTASKVNQPGVPSCAEGAIHTSKSPGSASGFSSAPMNVRSWRRKVNRTVSLAPGARENPAKGREPSNRLGDAGHAVVDVELRQFVRRTRAPVGDRGDDVQRSVPRQRGVGDLNRAVCDPAVGQAGAGGVERRVRRPPILRLVGFAWAGRGWPPGGLVVVVQGLLPRLEGETHR